MYPIWRFIRGLPLINRQIQRRMKVSADEVEQQLEKGLENRKFIQSIPKQGWAVVSYCNSSKFILLVKIL